MTPLLQAALQLESFFTAQRWEFCLIGGITVLRWGEPRYTRDIDATLLTGFGAEEDFIAALFDAGYRGRITDTTGFALRNRVLLLETPDRVPIDIALGGLPYEALIVARSTPYEFEPGCVLRTCSAEDLIVLKLFAFRPRDVLDVETVAVRQAERLDWRYIEEHLAPLAELKDDSRIMEAFGRIRASVA